jgi:hypothetical protein
MKMITGKDKEARQVLLHELRRATCLQASIWDICCGVIDETLGGPSTSPSRVIEVTPFYAGKQMTNADLSFVLSGLKEMHLDALCEVMNVPTPTALSKKMQDIGNLSAAARHTLLNAFQDAIKLQAELLVVASDLALSLDRTVEEVERGIWEVAIMVDTGMEVDEMDLRDFLGEPQPEGYTRTSSVMKQHKPN